MTNIFPFLKKIFPPLTKIFPYLKSRAHWQGDYLWHCSKGLSERAQICICKMINQIIKICFMFDNSACPCGWAFLKVGATLTDWFCLVIAHAHTSSLLIKKDKFTEHVKSMQWLRHIQNAHGRFQLTDIAHHQFANCTNHHKLHFNQETYLRFSSPGLLLHSEVTGGNWEPDPQPPITPRFGNCQFTPLMSQISIWELHHIFSYQSDSLWPWS